MMNLKQLRYFVRIAECGSLSKAADELGIAQPALSQQLRALEDELGGELMTRHSRGIAPNDLGTMLLSHFGTILNEIDRTPLLVQDLTRNPTGEVRLGVTTTAARALTAPLVAKVHESYPGITLHVVEAMSGSLSQSLQRGSLDLSILYEPKLLELDDGVDHADAYRRSVSHFQKQKHCEEQEGRTVLVARRTAASSSMLSKRADEVAVRVGGQAGDQVERQV